VYSGDQAAVKSESFPIQDEPEGAGMLRVDDQRARSRKGNPGTDSEVPLGHGGSGDLEAVEGEDLGHAVAESGVIIDEQNTGRHTCISSADFAKRPL